MPTARLFVRLSAASVCFSLFQAQHRAAAIARLFICLSGASVCSSLFQAQCRGAAVLFVLEFGAAAFVCPFVHSCTQHGFFFFWGGGW